MGISLEPSLTAYGREVTTPFDLIGNDENALSFALGFLFQKCPQLLQRFLRDIGLSGIRLSSLRKAEISLQEHGAKTGHKGITDIEVRLPGKFHVIVEAKIGFDLPTKEQCLKYVPRLSSSNEPRQRLVALVQSGDESYIDRYSQSEPTLRSLLVGYHWSHFLTHCVQLMSHRNEEEESWEWLKHFYNFLDQSYQMKAFTTEIWIVPVSTSPLWDNGWSFLDTHLKKRVYYNHSHRHVRPLYIGLRAHAKVEELFPVARIENGTAVIKYVPELEKLGKEWPYSTTSHTIWHLGDPVSLPTPFRAVRCGNAICIAIFRRY